MNIEKFPIALDPVLYHAWPDLSVAPDGRLVCVFNECTTHCFRPYTRIMLSESKDNGKTWSAKRPLTEGTEGLEYYYNCPRISTFADGRMAIIVDRIPKSGENNSSQAENVVYFSTDNGTTWSGPRTLPLKGIVPDKYRYLNNGRLSIAAHYPVDGKLVEFMHYSDDDGATWSDPVTVAKDERYNFCEVCMIPMGDNTVVALLRENSGMGYDCFKEISTDNGETWSEPVPFPLPGCHRPVAGFLKDGRVFITFRLCHGGGCGMGAGAQNFFGALTDRESLLSTVRNDAGTRLIPIDYDRALRADTGYSGWVQLSEDSLYVVNYIVDDALDRGQIRGYKLTLDEMLLPGLPAKCKVCNCPKPFCKRYGKTE